MKIQTKTTILFTVITATIFLSLNITVYYFVRSFANNDFEKRLELRTKIAAKINFEEDELSTETFKEIQKQYLERLPNQESLIFEISNGKLKDASRVPKEIPPKFVNNIINNTGATTFYENGFRHFAGLLYKDEKGDFVVIVSATNEYGRKMMQYLLFIKLFTLIVATIIIYSVGLYFANKTFQPIREVIDSVKNISEGNLHIRLKEPDSSDEIAELTATFNQMLNRLETAFEVQNNFISNASHELRTPLTSIIGEADYALAKSRSVEEYQQSLQQIVERAEKLQQLSKGLLALAQTGFDGKQQLWENIRIDQLIFDVKDNCDAILPQSNIKVVFNQLPSDEKALSIRGNTDLLKIAITNIVLNACKYSDNKEVKISLQILDHVITITIEDSGIGIPEDELKNIYDPFFRASNTKRYDGFGIGMPLSNNIIKLHKGIITVKSSLNVGTSVEIMIPLSN